MLTKLLWLSIALVSVFGLASVAQAQTKPEALTVVYAEESIAYRTSPNAAWQPLSNPKKAVILYPQYDLRLTPTAILALAQPGRRPLVIRKQTGIVKLANLRHSAVDEVTTALSDYFLDLWHNLRHHEQTIDDYAQNYMQRKGVVSRSEPCPPPLMLTPDYNAAIPGDSAIRFTWKAVTGTARYTFAIYNTYTPQADQLYHTDIADTTLLFSLDKPFLEKGVTYYWGVFPVNNPSCARYLFSLPKNVVFQQLEAKLATLRQQMRTDAALTAFVEAALYEKQSFYPEAYRSYFQAHRLAPANQLYRDGFALFLARRGMTQQAKTLFVDR